ncbi:MAG: protoporphyrinogen oxidase [bacterium]
MKRVVVIGGGVSGLATAFRVRQRFAARNEEVETVVLEAEGRLGGKIRSEVRDGYLFEWGPNGFLDGKPDTLDLCKDLGIAGELLASRDAARRRYVFSEGRLHLVPDRPGRFFRSPLLSLRGRLRILREPWVAATPAGLDTSIAEFGTRRLGKEAAEKLLDPMVSGIFAGDPALLSLEACFPRIAELERTYGSLIRALVALQRQRKRGQEAGKAEAAEGKDEIGAAREAGPAGPAGILVSFRDGVEALVRALAARLSGSCVAGCRVRTLKCANPGSGGQGGYRLVGERQGAREEIPADAVVVAAPAHAAAGILAGLDPQAGELLREIPYAPLAVVGLAFPEGATPGSLDGFGFLVPHREGTPVLGSLWTSRIFESRSPAGCVLTRNMVGGWRSPQAVEAEDAELEEMVHRLLERASGARGKVIFRYVVRHERAIPSYVVGHVRRLERIEERLALFPGVYLTGNAYRGVAINDCTREAVRVSQRIEADFLAGRWGH